MNRSLVVKTWRPEVQGGFYARGEAQRINKLLAACAPKTFTLADIHLEAPYECSSYVYFNTNSAASGNCRGNIIAHKINGLTRATKEGRKPSKQRALSNEKIKFRDGENKYGTSYILRH